MVDIQNTKNNPIRKHPFMHPSRVHYPDPSNTQWYATRHEILSPSTGTTTGNPPLVQSNNRSSICNSSGRASSHLITSTWTHDDTRTKTRNDHKPQRTSFKFSANELLNEPNKTNLSRVTACRYLYLSVSGTTGGTRSEYCEIPGMPHHPPNCLALVLGLSYDYYYDDDDCELCYGLR